MSTPGHALPRLWRDRVLAQFVSPANVGYLATAQRQPERLVAAAAFDFAQTGADLVLTAGGEFWDAVRRLNRAYLARAQRYGRPEQYADEPYHIQMLAADSLRPQGYESLNDPSAPLHGRTDDDSPWRAADPWRTAEQTTEEYYGLVKPEKGSRPMGGTSIPRRQKLSRGSTDRDNRETLGLYDLELESQHRGWLF